MLRLRNHLPPFHVCLPGPLEQGLSPGGPRPPGDAWRCLHTLLVVTTRGRGPVGIRWVSAQGTATHSVIPRTASHDKE